MCAAGEFEQLGAGVRVAPVGPSVLLNGLADLVLLAAPLAGLALEEGLADLAVELVDVHRVEAVLELVVLSREPGERLVVEALLVLMALLEALGREGEDVGVEVESAKQFAELAGD